MTSKRLGIVLVALFALWSLAGSGSFVSSSNTLGGAGLGASLGALGASLAYAGDPDGYTGPKGSKDSKGPKSPKGSKNSSPDGDPDQYGDPGPEGEEDPPSEGPRDDESVDSVNIFLEIALALLEGIGRVVN